MPEDYSKYGAEAVPKADYSKYGAEPVDQPPNLQQMGPGKVGLDILKGIGSGVVHTGVGTYNLIKKIPGLSGLPEAPQALQQAGSEEGLGTLGHVGRTAEQLGEFFAPGGAIEDMVGLASKAPGILRTPTEILTRGLGEAASAAGVSKLQGASNEQASRAALFSGITSGAFSTVGGLLRAIPAKTAYSLPSFYNKLDIPEHFSDQDVKDLFQYGVDNAINISQKGSQKAGDLLTQARGKVADAIANNASTPIDLATVRQPFIGLMDWAQKAGDPEMARKIQKTLNNFEEAYGAKAATPSTTIQVPGANPAASLTPAGMSRTAIVPGNPAIPAKLTLAQANDAKNALYGLLEEAYGRLGSNKKLAQKSIARGLREGIEDISPEVKGFNQDAQKSKIFQTAIDKYVESNPDLVSSGRMLAYSVLPALGVVSPKSLAVSIPAVALVEVLRNPRVRSALTIAAAHNPLPQVGSALGRTVADASNSFSPMPSPVDTSNIKVPNAK